jgi:ribosomal protein S18 acetylase RimI-like enzyme
MVNVQVRPAQVEDAQGVAVVHVETWRAAYQGLISQKVLDALRVDQREDRWSSWIVSSLSGHPTEGVNGPSHTMLIAEVDGRVAGWASFGAGRDDGTTGLGELAGLYVHPEYWSQKIGHALIERVEQEMLAQGWEQAYLWVLSGNDRAIRFYNGHSWSSDGKEKTANAGGASQLRELRHLRHLR